mmetsp:Transcript_21853/g.31829  ORF Transcript_21853/g.31829 Transcript_21853/m.31829 type:complete len:314 (+) Transcript_21853:1354-2295(+)
MVSIENDFVAPTNNQVPAGDEHNDELCSICYCEPDQPYYYRACGHGGCTSCLVYQFALIEQKLEVTIPMRCFSLDCNKQLIALSDLSALAPPEAMTALKEAAISKYVREHKRSVRYCPHADCNQILNLEGITIPTSETEEIALGGTVAACDQCNREYCLNCCDRDKKCVGAHKGDTCADMLDGNADKCRQYLHHITENILTLGCPSCGAAFLDFSGCCAVTCTCGQDFCGLCLTAQRNGSVCHAHVTMCKLNPNRGQYFCSEDQLNSVHRRTRIGNLRKYFAQTVPAGDTKRRLLKQCEKLFNDLGIHKNDIV